MHLKIFRISFIVNKTQTEAEEKISSEKVVKKVKDLAKTIRETSSTARETVRKFHESGAISELAEAYTRLQSQQEILPKKLVIQLRKSETAMYEPNTLVQLKKQLRQQVRPVQATQEPMLGAPQISHFISTITTSRLR